MKFRTHAERLDGKRLIICDSCDKVDPGRSKDYYMVTNAVWNEEAKLPSKSCMLCRACLSAHIGRPLVREDYTDAPVNWSILMDEFGLTIEDLSRSI